MWDYVLIGLTTTPGEDLLMSVLDPQPRRFKDLEPAFVVFDGADEGAEIRAAT